MFTSQGRKWVYKHLLVMGEKRAATEQCQDSHRWSTPGWMNRLTEKWGKDGKGEAALSVTSNPACFLWVVCICSDQKESFCSNGSSLTGRARWVTPIGRWSKPLCIRLLLNKIITSWGVWIAYHPASWWTHDSQERKKGREIKSKGKNRKRTSHILFRSVTS